MGITLKFPDQFRKNFNSINAPYTEMFWNQNQGSSIWGSRDIKRFRTQHTYYKMTKFFFDFWTDCHILRSTELLF